MIVAGIDAGTQSIKVLVYDSEKHEIMALSSSPLPLIEEEGGIREQKASWWIDALRKSLWEIRIGFAFSISTRRKTPFGLNIILNETFISLVGTS